MNVGDLSCLVNPVLYQPYLIQESVCMKHCFAMRSVCVFNVLSRLIFFFSLDRKWEKKCGVFKKMSSPFSMKS